LGESRFFFAEIGGNLLFLVVMKTECYNWDQKNLDKIVRLAAKILDNGGLVGLPTETVYGLACRAEPEVILRLDEIKARAEGKRYSLHLGRTEDVYRYVPQMPIRVKAFIRKGLPGPITLVCSLHDAQLAYQRQKLGDKVFNVLYENGSIGIRVPDCEPAIRILSEAVWPIVASSANLSGQEPATTGQRVLEYFDGQIEMVVDGGLEACRYRQSSTVVNISSTGIKVLREGAISRQEVAALSTARILFVCTGNTCRSPMAEAMATKYLVNKLSCKIDELDAFGYIIESFGVSAYDGCPASNEAVKVLRQKGVSLERHRSRLLTRRDVRDADVIFVMSRRHRDAVLAMDSAASNRTVMLDSENNDIPDPIGLGEQEYKACAERIEQAVEKQMKDIL
jgi:protein-tyrosine phosphatase